MRVRRVLAVSAIGLVVLVVAAVLIVHTNAVQSRALAWSVQELERRFNLELAASDLHYNLARRRVTLRDVRLSAKGRSEHPFFSAQSVTVQLPWAAYRGRLRFDDINVDGGRVLIHRDRHGVSNLPSGGKPRDPNLPPRRIDARGLTVRDLDFIWRDEQRDLEVHAPRVRTDLEYEIGKGATGPFAIGGDLVVRFGKRQVVVSPVQASAVFDGSNLEIANVGLKTAEGTIAVNGKINRVLDQTTLDLTLKGTADIEKSAAWAPAPVRVAGAATLEGTMKGAPSQFVMDTRLHAPAAEVGDERGVEIDAYSRLTPNSLTVSKAILHPASGGEVVAAAEVPFGNRLPWWLTANYSGLAVSAGFRLAEVEPLPFGAEVKGTARLDARPGHPFRLEVHNSSSPRSVAGTAPLAGELEFYVEEDRWRAEQKHRLGATSVSGDIGGVWNRRAVTRSTFGGKLSVRTTDVGDAARAAALFGFSAPAILRNTRGPMDAVVNLGGEFTSPRFVGTATTPGVDVPSIGRAAVTADFAASRTAINITNINGTVGGAVVKGEYLADLRTRRLGGGLLIDAPSAGDLLTAMPERIRLSGPLVASATIGGTVDAPDIAVTVTGTSMTLGGQPIDSLNASVRWLGDDVIVDSMTLMQGTGSLTAKGRYSIRTNTYSVNVDGAGIEWSGAVAQLGNTKAVMSVKFSGSGSVDKPIGEGLVEFDLTGGLAGAVIGHGTANVRLDGSNALVTAKIPSLGASIDAKIATSRPFVYDAIVIANDLDLEQVVRLTGLREGYVVGTASLHATASGTLAEPQKSRVFVNLQKLAATVESVPVNLASPSRFTWENNGLTIDALDVSVGPAGRLNATGRLAPSDLTTAKFQAAFRGELADLIRIGRPFGVPPELAASGPVSIDVRSTGGLPQTTAAVQVVNGSLTWGTLPTVANLGVDANFNGSSLDVTRLTGSWQGGGIEGSASIPRGVLESQTDAAPQQGFAKFRIVGLNEQALAPWVSRTTLSSIGAHISATADAVITRASLDGVSGKVTLDEANLIVAGVPVAQVRPSVFTINGGTVTAEDVVWSFGGFTAATVPAVGGATVPGGGELTLTGAASFAPADKASLDLDVKGMADLRVLSAFAPTIAVDGRAAVNVGVGGTPSTPIFSGRVDVSNAEVLIREPRIVLGDLNGTIAMDGQRVLFDNFRGNANGGDLVIEGGFLLSGSQPTSGALTVQLQGAALDYPRGLQSESDALLIIRPDDRGGLNLTGDVIVVRSVFNQPISIAALAAARQTRVPSPRGEEGALDQLHLNILLTTREDVRVDSNYARLEAGGAVRVGGTADEPALGGQVTLREGGQVYLAGRTFHVARGAISFTSPTRIEPEFDIELQTRVSDVDISLTINGPMDRLQTDVRSSDPTVDSREAMSMLFGNFKGEDAVTLLSAELLGATGRAVGLDTLRVERGFESDEFRADPGLIAAETDPSTRLTLSKRLRPDVEITLSQSLRESGGLSAVVSYKPRRNIEIRGISRDNLDRAIALRHEITFGGTTTAVAERPRQPTVSAITFSGDLRRPEAEVRRLLQLEVGDRFDFYNWQRDIDKMRDDYQDRNYYEVRIRGIRNPAPDGQSIALNYEIIPGPLAELVFIGHQLDQSLQEELSDSWRRTIFDRFLIEDIEARVRRHLTAEDYVGSIVEATVAESTPERKEVRVRVESGAKVSSRAIVYSGNQEFDEGDLSGVIKERGLDVDGWLEPAQIAAALADYYRDQGFLEVEVRADDARVSGSTATLAVTIAEGRRFAFEAISFPGVDSSRLPEIERVAGLEVEMPYVTTEVEATRRRIEDYYAARGFNSVRVDVNPVPDNSVAVVDVAFNVNEGPQQVVREIATEGATQTKEGVVTRTLRLRQGDPVNLAEWSKARKRLYDTNVFRQVDIEPIPLKPTPEDEAQGIQPVRAVVRLIEYPVWRLRYGLQLNDERISAAGEIVERQQTLGVLADIRNQNLFGRAFTAGISTRYERDLRAENVFLSNSSFFGLPIRSSGYIFDARQRFRTDQEVTLISDRRGVSAEQRWRPSMRGEVTYAFRFEKNHTFDPRPENPFFPRTDIVINTSKLSIAGLLDRRDDPFEPARGWFWSANWDQALGLLGSELQTSKLLVQQFYFRSVQRLVLATRAQFGIDFSKDPLLPFERFTLGGATTVRGYGENTLGPTDALGTGGDALILLNGEVRFPVRGWVQGVGFVDAGNVFIGKRDLSLTDLKVGFGIGLRLASPFAMLRLDFGMPASQVSSGATKKGRFYIGIGHIF